MPCKIISTTLLILGACSSAVFADRQLDARATIHFHGTSTLHDFDGLVKPLPFTAVLHENPETGALQLSAAADVRVQNMSTQHEKRDQNMMRMLDEPHFKIISGMVDHAVLPDDREGEAPLRISIHNVEQNVMAHIDSWELQEDQLTCRMRFPVSLKAFDLKAPSVLGIIRVGDTVDVECIVEGQLNEIPE
jgi:hypothetical protein